MKGEKTIIAFSILLFILFLIFVFIYYADSLESIFKGEDSSDDFSSINQDNGSENNDGNFTNEGFFNGVSGSGGGGAGSGGGVELNNEEIDFEDAECGFYFERYGVCAGRCPSGECFGEGRSCYCKEN